MVDRLPDQWWFERERLEVVATGFGPFLDHSDNPSWRVAKAFAEAMDSTVDARWRRLEVTYDAARSFATGRDGPGRRQRLAVHFGLAGGADNIAVERYAHNRRGQARDETGRHVWPDWVVAQGVLAHQTLVDVGELVGLHRAVSPGGLTSAVSREAGEYVCNAIYYHSLAAAWSARAAGRCGEALFIHVPPMGSAAIEGVGRRWADAVGAYLDKHL